MNTGLKLTLLMIFALAFALFTVCERSQINEAVDTEDVSALEKQNVSLTKGVQEKSGWDCWGWAVYRTKVHNQDQMMGCFPEAIFSETTDPTKAILCQWCNDHGAFVSSYVASSHVKVDEYAEWFDPHEQYGNDYDYPNYTHPLSNCAITKWWKKDAPAILVTIRGPTVIHSGETGTFTAFRSGGNGDYRNYRWWKRNDQSSKGKKGIKAPPHGEWIELTEWEGEQIIEQRAHYDFSLKCIVYDSWGNTGQDIHSVEYVVG